MSTVRNILSDHGEFECGGNGVEASIAMLLDRMHTGRFKISSDLTDWLDEFRMYHRKDGRIVKVRDDLMAATRYAAMMLRRAQKYHDSANRWKPLQYDNRGIVQKENPPKRGKRLTNGVLPISLGNSR